MILDVEPAISSPLPPGKTDFCDQLRLSLSIMSPELVGGPTHPYVSGPWL
jgi:hypothetical protein